MRARARVVMRIVWLAASAAAAVPLGNEILNGGACPSVPVIVLKDGRSGSSLFANLLNTNSSDAKHGRATFVPELLGKKTELPYEGMVDLMTGALRPPARRLGIPCPPVHGFSACPSRHDGSAQPDVAAAINETLARVPGARLVVFSRSNLFRVAVASHGTSSHAKREGLSCGADKSITTIFDIKDFACELPTIVAFRANLYEVAAAAVGAGKYYSVLFEALVADAEATLRGLASWLRLPTAATAALADKGKRMVPRREGRALVTTARVDCHGAARRRDESDLRLSDKPAFVAAVKKIAAEIDGPNCLLAMAYAPDNEAFPDVIPYRVPDERKRADRQSAERRAAENRLALLKAADAGHNRYKYNVYKTGPHSKCGKANPKYLCRTALGS